MALNQDRVLDSLRAIAAPSGRGNVVDAGMIRSVQIDDGSVVVTLTLNADQAGHRAALEERIASAVNGLKGVTSVRVEVQTLLSMATPGPPPGPPWASYVAGVKHVVAVASGKGGVGKSTVSCNFALALAAEGRKVGLLDADIYGPSQQMMMGAADEPRADSRGKIHPITAPGGVKVMSIGYIVDVDQPVIWRGPMLMKALEQFLGDVLWGDLDYLVVDLPPGTGDVALTLCQNVPLAGAVIVTTPQDVALIDARKGLNMFRKLEIPVLGIVENMAHYQCPECGHVEHVFGSGGGRRTAEDLDIPFLGAVPLEPAIVADGDSGRPAVMTRPGSPAATAFVTIADGVISQVEDPSGRG